VPPIECVDLNLDAYAGQSLIVDILEYDFEKRGDMVLFSYSGKRNGKFDGGPENPKDQVLIMGGKADLVYDDDAKTVKLTNFSR